jgi:hypothetical protein
MARVLATVAIVVALATGASALQPSAADLGAFMGAWTVMLDTPQGAMEQNIAFKEEGGKVVADLSSAIQPDTMTVSDVTKQGADVVVKFAGNYQGNAFDAMITMTPDGDGKAKVVFDVNGGQFSMSGVGTKK